MTMESAEGLLKLRLAEDKANEFVAAIDVRRARSGGITPLASHEPLRRNAGEQDDVQAVELPLPPLPDFSQMPPEVVEVKPTTAAGRIDRWQRKLLDLSLRNRVLNFSNSKKSIPFLCTDVAYLEDRLASGAAVRIISLPAQNPLGERDPALYRDVHGRDIQREFAAESLLRDELVSPLEPKELEARMIELYRQVKNDYAEGGANTLFWPLVSCDGRESRRTSGPIARRFCLCRSSWSAAAPALPSRSASMRMNPASTRRFCSSWSRNLTCLCLSSRASCPWTTTVSMSRACWR